MKLEVRNLVKKFKTTIAVNNISFETNVFERSILKAGAKLSGPAIIEQVDSTVVIPPNSTGTVDKYLNIIIKVNGGN